MRLAPHLGCLALCAALLVACSNDDGGSPEGGNASCASLLVFNGSSYWGYGEVNREPRHGRPLGTGSIPACHDTNFSAEDTEYPVRVAALRGVDPAVAVLTADGVWVAEGAEPPQVALDSRQPVHCAWSGARELTGTWISVLGGPPAQYDGDLNVPYRIGFVVAGADVGLPRWSSVTVKILVNAATSPTLHTDDVKQALWSEGSLTATVHCDGPGFVAESATTLPGS